MLGHLEPRIRRNLLSSWCGPCTARFSDSRPSADVRIKSTRPAGCGRTSLTLLNTQRNSPLIHFSSLCVCLWMCACMHDKVFFQQLLKACCCCSAAKSCLTLYDPLDCSPPGSPVHGIGQARILDWAAISFSRCCINSSDDKTSFQVTRVEISPSFWKERGLYVTKFRRMEGDLPVTAEGPCERPHSAAHNWVLVSRKWN